MHPTTTRRTLIAALALAACTAAQAQAWPSKPIRIVVPYPPGGSSDIIARAIAPALGEAFGQNVVVENKPGANGNTGTDFVAKSNDGHTLLLCDVGALAITASVYKQLPLDPGKDLRGVTMLANSPHLLVVHPSVPAINLAELVALSKKQKLNFAVTAIGSAPHMAGVPTIAEQGVKGFESGTWQGMLVPAATPPGVLAKLSAEVTRIIRSPAVRERRVSPGAEVHTMSPTEFTAFFERERKQWAGTVAQSGVEID
jgi:tripartite-type tricarboxylate transporter receptor subunit TctC